MTRVQEFVDQVLNNVEKVIVGKREVIELLMVALLCEGHVLIEDVPGTGKTMLARSIALSLGGQFKRLQCTPDLLPNDVTGVSIFNQQRGCNLAHGMETMKEILDSVHVDISMIVLQSLVPRALNWMRSYWHGELI